jgi:hypothetical protein
MDASHSVIAGERVAEVMEAEIFDAGPVDRATESAADAVIITEWK